MGAASSTEQKKPSTKVFLPSTPTQFSAGLISKMDTSIEVSPVPFPQFPD